MQAKKNNKEITRIDQCVKLIVEEAESRSGHDPVARIYSVCSEIDNRIIIVMDDLRAQERKAKKKTREEKEVYNARYRSGNTAHGN